MKYILENEDQDDFFTDIRLENFSKLSLKGDYTKIQNENNKKKKSKLSKVFDIYFKIRPKVWRFFEDRNSSQAAKVCLLKSIFESKLKLFFSLVIFLDITHSIIFIDT